MPTNHENLVQTCSVHSEIISLQKGRLKRKKRRNSIRIYSLSCRQAAWEKTSSVKWFL